MAIVLVDMDGVQCGWSPTVYRNVELECERRGIPVPQQIQRVQKTWKLKTGHELSDELIMLAMQHPTLYRNLPIIDGTKENMEALRGTGHDVFIVTTPSSHNENCASHKLQWVREHLGDWWVDRVILTADKTMVRGDYLIDDKPYITGHMSPTWKHIIFDAPYNQESSGHFRVKGWEGICGFIEQLEESTLVSSN